MIPKPNIEELAETPWAQDMALCMQDKEWHPEGDVWTHTCKAYDALFNLIDYDSLSSGEKRIVEWALVLHDVGKPKTSVMENGRIKSPRHSKVGAYLARKILAGYNVDPTTRELIVRLVRNHSKPVFAMQEEDLAERRIIELSYRTEPRLLYPLAKADTAGRDGVGADPMDTWIDLWQEKCQEMDCYDAPYQFANDMARFLFFRNELSSLHYTPHEEYSCEVIMMAGLPGAGKDTWLSKHGKDLPVISLDNIRSQLKVTPMDGDGRIYPIARERCQKLLRLRRNFAYNATNINRDTRRRWINLFHQYGAKVTIVYIEPLLDVIFEQNEERENPVPVNIIHEMFDNLDVPDLTECHKLVMGNFHEKRPAGINRLDKNCPVASEQQ